MERITLDFNKCIKCAFCIRDCPVKLNPYLEARNDFLQIDNPKCIKCGICMKSCPFGALSLEEERTNKVECKEFLKYEGVVLDVKSLSSSTKEIIFELDKEIEFTPGQFILVRVQEDPEIFRAYSIVSCDGKKIRLAIKEVEGGLGSPKLCSLKKGDKIYLEGPLGDFTLEESDSYCFVGVGIGIVPFVSLVREALEKGKKVILLHGAKYEEELFFIKEFREFLDKYSNFKYITTLTREEKEHNHKEGRVVSYLENLDLDNCYVYLCGMPALVEDCKKILDSKGISKIKCEVY